MKRYACYTVAGIATAGVVVFCAHCHLKQKQLKQQQTTYRLMSSTLTSHVSDGDYEQEMVDYVTYFQEDLNGYEDVFDQMNSEQKKLFFRSIQQEKTHNNFLQEIREIAAQEPTNHKLQKGYSSLLYAFIKYSPARTSPAQLLKKFNIERTKK